MNTKSFAITDEEYQLIAGALNIAAYAHAATGRNERSQTIREIREVLRSQFDAQTKPPIASSLEESSADHLDLYRALGIVLDLAECMTNITDLTDPVEERKTVLLVDSIDMVRRLRKTISESAARTDAPLDYRVIGMQLHSITIPIEERVPGQDYAAVPVMDMGSRYRMLPSGALVSRYEAELRLKR